MNPIVAEAKKSMEKAIEHMKTEFSRLRVGRATASMVEGVKVDAFISSPAKRAKKTAEYFIEAFGGDKQDIIFISSLYDAATGDFGAAVKNIDDKYQTVALFSHNPGITQFANELVSGADIYNMPTCSVFAVSSGTDKWKDFSKSKKEFLFFDYPKKEE